MTFENGWPPTGRSPGTHPNFTPETSRESLSEAKNASEMDRESLSAGKTGSETERGSLSEGKTAPVFHAFAAEMGFGNRMRRSHARSKKLCVLTR